MKLQNKIQLTLMGIIVVYLFLIFFIFTKLDKTSQEYKVLNTKINKLEGFVNNAKSVTTTVIPVNNQIPILIDSLEATQQKFVEIIEEKDKDLIEDFDDIQEDFQDHIVTLTTFLDAKAKNQIANIEQIYLTYLSKGKQILMKHIGGEKISNSDMTTMMQNSLSIINSLNSFKESYKSKMVDSIDSLVNNSRILKADVSESSQKSEHQIRDLQTFLETCAIISLIGGLILAYLLSNTIVKPIKQLSVMANQIAKGDLDQKLIINSNDAIGLLSQSFNEMTEAINLSQQQLAELNLSLEQRVIEKTESIQDLLDNAGQGFLSFDKDFKIQAEYSKECKLIFSNGIKENQDFITTFLPNDKQAQHEFKEWMEHSFLDIIDFEVICDLAIKSVAYHDRTYQVEYKKIQSSTKIKVMVILTDITSNLELRKQIEEEQSFARMILRVLSCRDQFFDYMNEMETLLSTKFEVMSDSDLLDDFFRLVHTLKGNGLMFELTDLGDRLHTFESILVNVKKGTVSLKKSEFDSQIDLVSKEFHQTKINLKNRLGDVIDWDEQSIKMPIELSKEILETLRLQSPAHYRKLLPFIHKKFKNLFSVVPLLIEELATKLQKSIKPVDIVGGNFFVDPEPYNNLMQSFVHLFRNAVDHGIEDPEEREEQFGKDPFGTITVDIHKSDDQVIHIQVSDDGKGINPELIKSALVSKSLKTEVEVSQMTDKELIESIFMAGFSSNSTTTSTSGRGIGMDAVKHEVDKLNGAIEIDTQVGKGTTFFITIPALSNLN